MSDTLVTTRSRDAHAVFRGFIYQIDLTLERWIELVGDEELILEAGEDIDYLAQALTGAEEPSERTLEQVKNLTGNITLRSAPSVECIASFIEHRHNNPHARLKFRFTTTALPAVEQGSSLGSPGIEVWERLRRGDIVTDADNTLLALLSLLRSAGQPSGLAATTWERFSTVVSGSPNDFMEVLRNFEWSVGAPSAADREKLVREALVAAFGDDEAYPYLFMHVCKLLTQPGLKRLVRHDLAAVSQERSRDLQIFARTVLEPRLSRLKAEFGAAMLQLDNKVSALEEGMQLLRAKIDDAGALQVETASRLELQNTPPPLPVRVAHREQLVNILLARLQEVQWLAIHGEAGIGKSALVALLSRQSHDSWFPAIWIRLRDAQSAEGAVLVDRVVHELQQLASRGVAARTVVLEDLPRATSGDLLSSALLRLAALPIKVVSTAAHPLPRGLQEILGAGLHSLHAPYFNEGEALELLQAYGAPGDFGEAASVLLVSRTGGHPALVAAAVHVLQANAWSVPSLAAALIEDGYAHEIASEAFERLLSTVEDAACRELLNRSALAFGDLSRQQLRAVAAVKPELTIPDDCVHRAIGTWLRDEGGGRVSVSPLLRVHAADRLAADVARGTRLALGDSILKMRSVTPSEVVRAFGYFASAEDWSKVAFVLLQSMSSLRRTRNADWAQILVDLSTPVVSKLDNVTATMISAERLALSRDPAKTVEDKARIVAAAADTNTPAWVLTYICSVAGLDERQHDFEITLAMGYAAVRVVAGGAPLGFPGRPDITAPVPEIDAGLLAIMLLFHSGTMIERPTELRAWTELFKHFPSSLADRALHHEHANGLLPYIANRVWIAAVAGGVNTREQWQDIASSLKALLALGASMKSELVVAVGTRALTIVLAERLDRRSEAISAAQQTANGLLASWPRFLVLEAVAAQTLYAGDAIEARKRYEEALAYVGASTDIEVVDSCIRAAMAADDESALGYAERAEALAKAMPNALAAVVARSEFETAIALLRSGRSRDALAKAVSGYEMALVATESADSPTLRTVLAVGGHILWFLYMRARSGEMAALAFGSGEPLRQGMVLNAPDAVGARADEAALVRGRGSLCMAAAFIGDRARALAWGKSAWTALRASSDPFRHFMLPVVADTLCAAALLERRYGDALLVLHTALSSPVGAPDGNHGPTLDPDHGTMQVALPAAILALMWDDSENDTTAFVTDVGGAIPKLREREGPNCRAMNDSCSQLLSFLSAIPGWREVHHAPMPDEIYPAKNLVASLASDAAPRVAATLQVLAMDEYSGALRAFPTIRSWVVVPALLAYWKRRVASQAFHFMAPAHLQATLQAITGSDENALRAVLAAIVDSTQAKNIPAKGIAWLRGRQH